MDLLQEQILKVSSTSKPKSVAGALAAVLRTHGKAELHSCGAGAVNQSVKAIAIARGYVAPDGMNICTIPAFQEQKFGEDDRTIIRFIVEPR